MKFTLGWLKDHLDTQASLDEILEALTAVGLEVEGVDDPAKEFAAFKVAYVESAEQHPNADRLRVCKVNTGAETLQVVCGAPNARTGMKGIFAPVGSYIPGIDITLKKGNIRGEDSHGMLVSEREMKMSDDHEGIIEVDEKFEIGTPMADVFSLNDPVIEIAVTPNRGDCAGVRGIARDLAAFGLGTLKPLDTSTIPGTFDSPINVNLKFDQGSANACPLFMGRYIKNVKNGPSPDWVQKRLKAIGLRPISALVDITNYVSYDLCRPLHVFDADKLSGDIHVRLAQKGEKLEALNEKTYDLDDFMTVVCDDNGPTALAGVMGDIKTGCTDETTNVYLECAWFDPVRTARTGRALQINSDARYRFERDVDPEFTVEAAELATRLILEFCGGEPSSTIKAGDVPTWQRTIAFNPAQVKKLTGLDVNVNEQNTILAALGFEVSAKSDTEWAVQPPAWRSDVHGSADIVEEIARIHGYDKIEITSLPKTTPVTMAAESTGLARIRRARTMLAARGMDECVTWSFMDAGLARQFYVNDNQDEAGLKLTNPISSELDQMRPSILPNLIAAAGRNHDRGHHNNALFEVGPVFITASPDDQPVVAAGIRSEAQANRHWSSTEAARPVDAFDAKADALAVLEACGAPAANAQISKDAPSYYHPGRSGALRLGKNVLAWFGEIHPAILKDMDIKGPVVGFEVFVENIPEPKKKGGTAKPLLQLSPFQPLDRDFAFIVDRDVEVGSIVQAIRGADKNLISDVTVFDIYTGEHVGADKKSVALNVFIEPKDGTLTDKDLEDLSGKIIESVTHKTGGQLRG